MNNMSRPPLPFQPSFEQVPEDEAQTIQELSEAIHLIMETTFKDSGHASRGVHAKSHGLLQGRLEVLPDLPPELAQGIFSKPASYPVVLRFSTNPGDILDDKVSTPRGLAIKIVGVEGVRLPGSENEVTQDFVMQNAPAFTAPTPKAFLANLKLLAKTTDKAPKLKQAFSAILRGAETAIEAVGGQSATVKSLGGHPKTNLLGETYYTVAPLLYGQYYSKISVAPVSPSLTALTDAPVDLDDKPNGLREAVSQFFEHEEAQWEIRVQLATDLEKMPIEDASKVWSEEESPYRTVARLTVPAQPAWSEARAAVVDDRLSFSPWHGVAAHRPLGGVMRSRKSVYEKGAAYRGSHNGCPIHEPKDVDTLPS